MNSEKKHIWRKLSVIPVVIFTLMASECEEALDEDIIDQLVGIWNMTEQEFQVELVSNKQQTALDFHNPGTGSIDISGDLTASLRYMVPGDEEFTGVLVMSHALTDEGSPLETFIMLILDDVSGSGMLMAMQGENFLGYFLADSMGFTYDGITLNMDPSVMYYSDLYSIDSNRTITLQGTLTLQSIAIPANTPTIMDITIPMDFDMTMKLNEDGTFLMIDTYSDGEDTYSDSFQGTWELDGDMIIFSEDDSDLSPMSMAYDLSEGVMSAEIKEDCAGENGFDSEAECLETVEILLGLETGTVISAVFISSYEFHLSSARTVMKRLPMLEFKVKAAENVDLLSH